MAEYIEKAKLIEKFQNEVCTYDVLTHPMGYYVLDKVDDVIYNEPVVDVVPVVRCKDCKYNVANWQHDEDDGTDYTDIVCDYWMSDGLEPDKDFCSKGERIDA